MERFYHTFKKVSDGLNSLIKIVVFVLLFALVITVTIQIIFRVFFTPFSWTEELSRYLLVWDSLLAATVAYKQNSHIAITFVIDKLAIRAKKMFRILSYSVSILFFIVAIYYGIKMISLQIYQTSPALLIPMKIVYLCLPLSFLVMLYHGLVNLIGELIKFKEVEK